MTTANWQCSRCGQWGGNPSCYVCAVDEDSESNADSERDFWIELQDEEPEQNEK